MSGEEDHGFLGRWSRLKRTRDEPAPEAEAVSESDPAPEQDASQPEPETLSDEELAALPRIEDLTEGSDIDAFLKAGVPRDLRNAALRRMWMLTPAIRDYRDPAVDYAWDWNTPGGVPGDGVAPSPERAAEMLRSLVAPRKDVAPERPAPELPSEARPAESAMDSEDGTVAQSAAPDDDAPAQSPDDSEMAARQVADAPPETDAAPDAMPRRRHGSALPG